MFWHLRWSGKKSSTKKNKSRSTFLSKATAVNKTAALSSLTNLKCMQYPTLTYCDVTGNVTYNTHFLPYQPEKRGPLFHNFQLPKDLLWAFFLSSSEDLNIQSDILFVFIWRSTFSLTFFLSSSQDLDIQSDILLSSSEDLDIQSDILLSSSEDLDIQSDILFVFIWRSRHSVWHSFVFIWRSRHSVQFSHQLRKQSTAWAWMTGQLCGVKHELLNSKMRATPLVCCPSPSPHTNAWT